MCGEASIESRFAAIRAKHLPLIGRAHEMGLMRERWHLARQGEGQIVTVILERRANASLSEFATSSPRKITSLLPVISACAEPPQQLQRGFDLRNLSFDVFARNVCWAALKLPEQVLSSGTQIRYG